MTDWQTMDTAPRDGSSFDVLCRAATGNEVIIENLHYAFPPMGRGEKILWGKNNFLSPHFTPLGWRLRPTPAPANTEELAA